MVRLVEMGLESARKGGKGRCARLTVRGRDDRRPLLGDGRAPEFDEVNSH
jgi:hypothetical protein